MKLIGITGTSGAGKSTICKILKDKYDNVEIIDADKIAKECSRKGTVYLKSIAEYFGEDILNKNGELNRKKLANIIYENEEQREKLNSLTFIYVIDAIKEKISKLHKKIVIIDAPLLFESKLDQICDFTIGVIAVKDLKVKRIMDRDNISQANALSRLNAQISDEFLIKNADFIVNNNENDILKLKEQIDKLDIKVKESNI